VRVGASLVLALCAAFAACAAAAPRPSTARLTQSGSALPGQGGGGQYGDSIALSGDGSTALVGAPDTNVQDGTAFFYARSGSTWKQQGPAIKGSTLSYFGSSVALSASGNIALISEPGGVGHVWFYTRSGSAWKRQAELAGKGVGDDSGFGNDESLALSGDGNTAVVGDNEYHGGVGAVWFFTRSRSGWTQDGEFAGSGGTDASYGQSVAVSADGTTALVSWVGFHNFAGAVQIYTRSGTGWKPGALLTGRGEAAGNGFGNQVALSADADTAFIVGQDLARPSKVWAFARHGSAWTQTQLKTEGPTTFGSLTLSADGKTALVGDRVARGGAGAVYAYTHTSAGWILGTIALSTQAANGAGFGNSVAVSANASVALVASAKANDTGTVWPFAAAG
jgi:phage gpG-like protein